MKKKVLSVIGIIVVILAVVVVVGFHYLYSHGLSGQYANSNAQKGQIKVACVGDSITYGHGVENWKENNYPAQLQKILGDEYHVMNFGSSGACVNSNGDQPYISRDVYQESLDYDADILIFMLGTNDSKPENWTDMDTFMTDYVELLRTYLEGENPPQVYIGLCAEAYYIEEHDPATGIAGFDTRPAIVDEIVVEIEKYALGRDEIAGVIDIHSLTEAHPEWFEADGIHPNADGAKAIAETVADAIKTK